MAESPQDYSTSPDDVKMMTQGSQHYHGMPNDAHPPIMGQPMGGSAHHTTVIVNQPMTMQNTGPRLWSSGICGCFDEMSSCCLGVFCPLILACRVATDMGESCCVPCCVNGGVIAMRTKIRTQHNIQGSIMDDGFTACCCWVCMVCQMSRELTFIRNTQPQSAQTGYVI